MKPELKQNRHQLKHFILLHSDLNCSKSYSLRSSNLVLKRTNLRVFKIAELKAATNDFGISSKIGEGEFWSVHKGTIKSFEHPYDDIQVAVKLANGSLKASLSSSTYLYIISNYSQLLHCIEC